MERFEFLSTIGQGAYGKVWKCRCKRSGRLVAIKEYKDRGESTQRDNIHRELLPLLVRNCSSTLCSFDELQLTTLLRYIV